MPSRPDVWQNMRHSVTSVFSEPDDFEAAMHAEGSASLVTTASGRLHAKLTQVGLNGMRLLDVHESVSRVAFIKAPDNMILVSLSLSRWPNWFWNGQEVQAGELITLGPCETAHTRTNGAIHWCAIWLVFDEFARLSQALVGTPIDVPRELCRWRPPPVALRQLSSLHQIAIKAVQVDPHPVGAVDAAHGLEQQLLQAVTRCLAGGSRPPAIATRVQSRDLMLRLEELLAGHLTANLDVRAVSAALGVSERLLRQRCVEALGMSPNRYLWLRRMHAARLILRKAPEGETRIAEVAQRCGFRNPGRFAGAYKSLFGEQPSATLRHGPPPVPRHRATREHRPRSVNQRLR